MSLTYFLRFGFSPVEVEPPELVAETALAALLGVDSVKVAKSVYTSDEEGTAEASVTYADVVSDSLLLYWTPPGASRLAPSAGYLFNWRPAAGGGLTYVRRGREDRERFDWIEVHAYLDWVQPDNTAGVFMSDAVD